MAIVYEESIVRANQLAFSMLLGMSLISGSLQATCDLTQFRWGCAFKAHRTLKESTPRLVYCGNTAMYLSTEDYLRLIHNRKAHIQMNLNVNGEHVESPCIPQ